MKQPHVPLKVRIASWLLAKRIRKEIEKMKPFPKWFGAIGAVGALVTAIGLGIKSGYWTGLAPAIGAIMAFFSHSATGTGGTPQ